MRARETAEADVRALEKENRELRATIAELKASAAVAQPKSALAAAAPVASRAVSHVCCE